MSRYKRYERYKDSGVEWIGEIPEHWTIKKLKWLCSISTGNKDTIDKEDDGIYPFFVRSPIVERISTYSYDGEAVLTAGDGVGVGKVFHYINGKFDFHQRVYKMSDFKEVLAKYFYYYIKENFIKETEVNNAKSTVDSIRLPMIQQFPVTIPSAEEQITIINFLDEKIREIDGLIADKEKLIELLQEKRQAIVTEAVTKGLNPNVRMKDSGIEWIGEIPEHWTLSKIKYVSLINNKTLSESTDDDYEIDYIDISSVTSIGEIDGIQRLNFKDAPSRARRILSKGDTIVSTVRTYLKAIAFIENVQSNLICSTGFAVLTPLSKVVPKYLFYLMRSEKYVNEIVRRSVGVSYPAINTSDIGALECAIPNKDEQKYIVEYLDNCTTQIDQLVNDIQTQIQKLKEYRQSLISEAVTGEIDVRDYDVNN